MATPDLDLKSPVPETKSRVPNKKLQLRFSYLPFTSDLALRYAVLALWRVSFLNSAWFWLIQLVVIPAIIFTWIGRRQSAIKERFSVKDNEFEVKDAAHWIIAMVLLMIHAGYQVFARVTIGSGWQRETVAVFLTIVAACYVLTIAVSSESEKIAETGEDQTGPSYDASDENDRLLIWMQTEVSDFQRTVDSYTIESTLIGALAFSAFVTIVSSDKATLVGVKALLADLWETFHAILTLNVRPLREVIAMPFSSETVMVAIACAALIASMFFVAVIVARLRFNSLVGLATYSLEVTAAFNDKEDEIDRQLLFSQPGPAAAQERLGRLREQISYSLSDARLAMEQLRPIISYMRIFRHVGVLTFLCALVASAMWVSPVLAAGFTLIAVLAYGYPTLDRLVRDAVIRKHGFFSVESLLKKTTPIIRRKNQAGPK
jgi:hypothetical protein